MLVYHFHIVYRQLFYHPSYEHTLTLSFRRVPASFTPTHPSSLTTTSTSVAAQTPLPSSDDSDLFLSPLQSPSDLNDTTAVSSLSSSVSTVPSLSLSVGGDTQTIFKEALEEAVEMETAEQNEEQTERKDEELTTKECENKRPSSAEEGTDEQQQSSRNERVETPPMSVADKEQSKVKAKRATQTAAPMAASPAMKELMSQLTRKTISSEVSLQVTPLSGRVSTHFSNKSTSSLSSSVASPPVSTSSTAATKMTGTFFSPIPMLDELIAAKHRKLKRSLDESKKHELARIAVGPHVEQKNFFSTTMVQQMKTKEATVESATTTLKGSQYSFSPPAEMRVESEPANVSSPPTEETHPASFVFSPPLTRSATRRLRSSGDTSILSNEQQLEKEASGHRKRGKSRY